MNLLYRFSISALMLLFFSSNLSAQSWVEMMLDPNVNFYTVQAAFQQWENENKEQIEYEKNQSKYKDEKLKQQNSTIVPPFSSKLGSWKQFKRWEDFMAPRVYPTGDRNQLNAAMHEHASDLINSANNRYGPNPSVQAGNWSIIGPTTNIPTGGGAGRANCIRLDPTNSNTLYVGSPGGGLWKSTNGGSSWTMWNTDALPAIGVTDIAIDPTNTQIMYLATGDGDAGDTYSLGVLKSTDGGVTWNTTGLNWTVTNGRTISKLLIDPTNTQIVHAATSNGIYRTTDGGTNWTQVQAGIFKDIEFQPGNSTILYAARYNTAAVFRSSNSGAAYTQVTTGLPTNALRFAIAVTAANNQYVYVLACNTTNYGILGFYRSTNGGTSFAQVTIASPTNILGWQSNGSDAGGQGWFDLALAASPTNANELVSGGINIWRTTNGGANWTINAHWTGSGAPYVHADMHDLIYTNGTTVYSANDGGLFRTTNNGGAWSDLSNGLQIAQMYNLGTSATNANINISGWQDNGTSRVSSGAWARVIGGDGMECLIDYTTSNTQFGELYYGSIYRTTNNWGGATNIVTSAGTGVNAQGNWVTPYVMSPASNQELLVGKAAMYKSTNQGTTWAALGATTGGTGNIVRIAYAPSNTQVIYCIKQNAIFKSTNGGTLFTNITGTLPTSQAMTYVAVGGSDPNKVYLTYSGYAAATKVYQSLDGGTTWTNISTGLPNLPCNTVVYQNGSADGIYVGTDVGVYYRDNSSGGWVSYMTGLPNVIVKELEIQYSAGKVRAATYGRGMWQSDLFSAGNLPPIAQFTSNMQTGCPGQQIQFTDQTTLSPTSWSWLFPGGTPASSSAQNPLITYNTVGTYQVTLWAFNSNGNDSVMRTSYITISNAGALPFNEGFEAAPFLPANWFARNINNDGVFWSRATNASGFSTSTACSAFDNYTQDVAGARDEMWTPKYNLSSVTTCSLRFDVAYARYDATYSDTLEVLISTNCGNTWTQIYINGGAPLSTAPDQTATAFVPTSAQWRTETININSYAGQGSVMFAFRNRGRYGQWMYIDNINLQYTTGSMPTSSFTASASTICQGNCITFTNTSTGGTSWSWTFPGGSPSTSTAQNPPSVCYNTAGTYTAQLVTTNGNGSSTATQAVTVNANPTANAGNNVAICSGGSTTLNGTGGGTYSWAPTSGLSSTTVSNPAANPTTTTTYTLTVTTNGCSATSTVTVTVNPNPTPNAGAPATICAGNSTNLSGSGGTTYTWSPASSLSCSICQNPVATPTATTTYTLLVTNSFGCTATATKTVTVTPLPAANAGNDVTICVGNNTTLNATGGGTYVWSPATGLSSTTIANPVANPTVTTTYTVTVTNNGCTATDVIVVTVNPPPVANAGTDATICWSDTTQLSASGGGTYLWTPATGLSSTTIANPLAYPAVTTNYTVTVSNGGCTATDAVTVTVNPIPFPYPVITQNGNQLSTTTFPFYQWYLNGNPINGATQQNYTITQSGTYTVCVTNNFGCSSCSSPINAILTGFTEEIVGLSLNLYPNPNNGIFDLIMNFISTDNYQIEITNTIGQVVYKEELKNYTGNYIKRFDLTQEGKGTYMLIVRNTENQTVKRVIVF
jgi:PKD repeat protein